MIKYEQMGQLVREVQEKLTKTEFPWKFTAENISTIYPLLHVTGLKKENGYMLIIPFMSERNYNVHRLHKFPIRTGKSLQV